MTQTELVLEYMRKHGSITPIEALEDFGCMRLAARVNDLRRRGVRVETEIVKASGYRWARYSLGAV